jgi:chloramphenicol O-acetyltransferase type B
VKLNVIRRLRRVVFGFEHQSPTERGTMSVGPGTYLAGGLLHQAEVVRYPGDTAMVRIGSYSSIAADVQFLPGGNHHLNFVTTFPPHRLGADNNGYPWSKGDIRVGSDVWIGRGARVLSGVNIGDGAVVAAYSVVVHDVEPYAIVGGNPARFIRLRFSTDVVAALRAIAWWEWSDELVRERAPQIGSSDVEAFIADFG